MKSNPYTTPCESRFSRNPYPWVAECRQSAEHKNKTVSDNFGIPEYVEISDQNPRLKMKAPAREPIKSTKTLILFNWMQALNAGTVAKGSPTTLIDIDYLDGVFEMVILFIEEGRFSRNHYSQHLPPLKFLLKEVILREDPEQLCPELYETGLMAFKSALHLFNNGSLATTPGQDPDSQVDDIEKALRIVVHLEWERCIRARSKNDVPAFNGVHQVSQSDKYTRSR